MAELGIAASVIAVLQISGAVITSCYKYQAGVKSAPRDVKKLLEETTAFRNVVEQLLALLGGEDASASAHLHTIELLNKPGGLIEKCFTELKAIEEKLSKSDAQHERRFNIKALKWPLKEAEVNKALDKIRETKTTLSLALNVDQARATQAVHSDLTVLKESYTSDKLDEYRQNIRRWLAAPDPSVNHNSAREKHHQSPTTGVWLLESKEFAEWMAKPRSFVWLHGIPGCGKTILCSTVIHEVASQCKNDSTLGVAYFYFDFNDADKQSCDKLVRSVLVQFLSQCQNIPEELQTVYSRCQNDQKQPTFDELLFILRGTLSHFRGAYLIIDALDECKEREERLPFFINELVDWKLDNLHILATSRKEEDIKDWLQPLASPQFCLQELLDADIRIHICERLRTDPRLKRWPRDVQNEVKETLTKGAHGMFRWVACQLDEIRRCLRITDLRKTLESLPKDLDDTYARILSNIDDAYSEDATKMLQWLCFSARPVTLDEMVEVLAVDLQGCPTFDTERRLPIPHDILRICPGLVSIAVRRSNHDVKNVSVYDDKDISPYDGDDTSDHDDQSASDNDGAGDPGRHGDSDLNYDKDDDPACDKCGVEELRLAHFSVKEYLVSKRIATGPASKYSISEGPANVSIAEICVTYLLAFENFEVTCDTLTEFPLSIYAAKYWIEHYPAVAHEPCTARLDELIVNLLCVERRCFVNWLRLINPDGLEGHEFNLQTADVPPPLYYASLLGLATIASQLLEKGATVNAQGGYHGSALQAASYNGYDRVIKLLLESGADINAQGGFSGTPLQAASLAGHGQVLKLLLDNGADVNAHESFYDSALQTASRNGNAEVVQLLLDGGAEITSYDLKAAASKGNKEIVQLLLNRGPQVTSNVLKAASGSLEGNKNTVELLLDRGAEVTSGAVEAAASYGKKEIVELLLDRGGEATNDALEAAASGGYTETAELLLNRGGEATSDALQAALSGGYTKTVELLLDRGVVVTSNALAAAARWGRHEVFQLLLDRVAEATSDALQAAASGGYTETAELLLDRGVEVTSKALEAAARWGGREVFQLLLDRGAEVPSNMLEEAASWEHGRNIVELLLCRGVEVTCEALETAVSMGSEETVMLLLDRGAEITSYALVRAAARKHEGHVRLLLGRGAKIDAQTHRGNALHYASWRGYANIVELLLRSGADINIRGPNGSALQEALSQGHVDVIKLLLDRGAEVTSGALEVAAEKGNEDVVRLLLDRGVETTSDALEAATSKGWGKAVKLLLERGATFTTDVLYLAPSLEITKILLSHRESLNNQDKMPCNTQRTELYWEHKICVRILLGKGLDVDSCVLKGATSPGHGAVVRLMFAAAGELSDIEEAAVSLGLEKTAKLLLDGDAYITPNMAKWPELQQAAAAAKLLPDGEAVARLTYRITSSTARRWSIG